MAKKKDILKLRYLWAKHDMLERKILLLERKFTDKELKKLGSAAGG